jgi:hypothetical protein
LQFSDSSIGENLKTANWLLKTDSIIGFRDWLFQLERRPVSTQTNSIQEEQFGYHSNNERAA